MTFHVVLTFLAICATPWAIGLGILGVSRWLATPADASLELTDDHGETHRVEAHPW